MLGVRMDRRPERLVADAETPGGHDFCPAGAGLQSCSPGARQFLARLRTQAANPKALVFFTALLPQFIQPYGGVPMQILILGISSIVLEFGVLGLYVAASTRARAGRKRLDGPRRFSVQPAGCWSLPAHG